MDKQVLLAIISGLFGAVITPLIAQVVIPGLKAPRKDSPKPKTKTPLLTFLQAGVGGVIGVFLGYLLIGPVFTSPCAPFAPTSVNITSPMADTSVPQLVSVQGTACHIPNGKELWLLVLPEGVTGYYPQIGPVVVSDDNNWSVSAYVGLDDPSDIGRGFVLIAALADQQGSTAIREYFTQSSSFIGLEPLPIGIHLMEQVRVIRK